MKFHISAFTIIFSSSASANWFDGFKQASTFMSNVTSWNTIMLNQGNSLSKGNTSLDFCFALGGRSIATKTINRDNTANSTKGSGQVKVTTDMFAPLGFNPSYPPPTQDYIRLKAMWEAQRKQAEYMLKRIEEAQKAVASAS